MIKNRTKNKYISIAIFLVLTTVILLSANNMTNVKAIGGTDYVKYTYATGQTQSYNLPEIPTYYYRSLMASADPRENAPANPTVINIGNNGTGFIVGDHEIMTAAHVVYGMNSREFASSMTLYVHNVNPSNSVTYPRVSLTAISAHIPKAYSDYCENNQISNGYPYELINQDYAIITVNQDLTTYGCYSLGMATNNIMGNNTPVHILGYTHEVINNNVTSYLKISNGTVTSISDNFFTSSALVFGGTSGGPVYTESVYSIPGTSTETYQTVIAVASATSGTSSIVTRIRPETMQFLYRNSYL